MHQNYTSKFFYFIDQDIREKNDGALFFFRDKKVVNFFTFFLILFVDRSGVYKADIYLLFKIHDKICSKTSIVQISS